jgi:hypothetical protein
MPSNREMRRRIDEADAMFKEAAKQPYEIQIQVLEIFKDLGLAIGDRGLTESMTRMMSIPPADLPEAFNVLRGQMLVIKRDQFGG